jgi:hypothetical protein
MTDTLAELVDQYRTDPQSAFSKLSYGVRTKHARLLARIVREHGGRNLQTIRPRDLVAWHRVWLGDGKIAIAHALITRLRAVFRFGATILEDGECRRIVNALAEMRFETPLSRHQPMSSEQAKAIRVKARAWFGWDSIALAQALQFELGLSQKDVIGEWVPVDEAGVSDVRRRPGTREEKWLSGLRWSDIDEEFILRHAAGTRRLEIDLKKARMVMEELALTSETPIAKLTRTHLPVSGPVIICEINGWPYSTAEFRRKWRLVADRAGIPKNITNKDSNKRPNSSQQ